MCFSASVSFTVSAVLIPTGLYCMNVALNRNSAYLLLAVMPLAFGVQQAAEGVVWMGLHTHQVPLIQMGAVVFLFFSHCFWLAWTPWLAFNLESDLETQRLHRFFTLFGVIYGAMLYLPVVLHFGEISAAIVHGSINYQARFIADFVPVLISRSLYAAIILIPLLLSSNLHIKRFGTSVTVSIFIAYLSFNYAFVSVWCFFAALLSFYIVYVILQTDALNEALVFDKTMR
ncbi:DUF6629 family protein [Leptolyngbya sp. AN02str]|uniref:DUF6629 family protein n=1 Tax=Leptolyngbya sp. AN02str TaxID=3423363 RepID=UPI003D313CE6